MLASAPEHVEVTSASTPIEVSSTSPSPSTDLSSESVSFTEIDTTTTTTTEEATTTTSTTTTTTTTSTTTTTALPTTTSTAPELEAGDPLLEFLKSEPEDRLNFEYLDSMDTAQSRVHIVNITTGTWIFGDVENVFSHFLVVFVPKYRDQNLDGNGFFYSTEGPADGSDMLLSIEAEFMKGLAERTGSVTALLYGNPPSPLRHGTAGLNDTEEVFFGNQILALSWDYARKSEPVDPSKNAIFPILRSVLRSLDAVTDIVAEKDELPVPISNFCVMSEVPFVAWLAGVDPRVKCAVPILTDLINGTAQFERQYRSMAGWSHHWAGFGDLFDDLGSRELWEVLRHVDPIYQPERFNHTILMLRAGNDEASVPDATYDFYDKMSKNQKIYLRSLPNSLHEIDERFRSTIEGFYVADRSLSRESPQPTLNWTMVATEEQNEIIVTSDRRPSRVTVWMSETQNRNKKDFRLLKLDKDGVTAQNSQYLPFKEPPYLEDITFSIFDQFRRRRQATWTQLYSYKASFELPPKGYWKAYFIELEFVGRWSSQIYTTETNVIPNRLPWQGCWQNQRKKHFYDCEKKYERRFL